jgi:hypothetical protein
MKVYFDSIHCFSIGGGWLREEAAFTKAAVPRSMSDSCIDSNHSSSIAISGTATTIGILPNTKDKGLTAIN